MQKRETLGKSLLFDKKNVQIIFEKKIVIKIIKKLKIKKKIKKIKKIKIGIINEK